MSKSLSKRRKFSSEPWNFFKEGGYGVFTSAKSIPIEYLLTTFHNSELKKLRLAQDLTPDRKIDFESMMQRDLDTTPKDGAVEKLKEYLIPSPTSNGLRSKPCYSIFFPPLLIACVPCENNRILPFYPAEEWDGEHGDAVRRTWENLFQMEIFKSESSTLHKFDVTSSIDSRRASVDTENARVKFNLSQDIEKGVKLVAIDGQHRLRAMQDLTEDSTHESYLVPVCILFATHSIAPNRELGYPNVLQTFRKVFVDVNTNMTTVGKHFGILLNDNEVGSIIVREFCSLVTSKGREYLSGVEWNVRGKKDATILTRDYSITSIGILERALTESFGQKGYTTSLLPRVLDSEDIETQEKLNKAALPDGKKKPEWYQISHRQREVLQPLIRDGIVLMLYRIFFETEPFKTLSEDLIRTITEWEKNMSKLTATKKDFTTDDYKAAYTTVTTHHNKKELSPGARAIDLIQGLEQRQRELRKSLCPVMGHALFQRSMFLSLRWIMERLVDTSIHEVAEILLHILKHSMDPKLNLFAPQQYTLYSIWKDDDSIVNLERTRTQMSRLTLAVCGGDDFVESLLESKVVGLDQSDYIVERLRELGQTSVSDYWGQYRRDRIKHFKDNYRIQSSFSAEQIEEIREAIEIEKDPNRTDTSFASLTTKYLGKDFEKSQKSLSRKLGFVFKASEDEYSPSEVDDE